MFWSKNKKNRYTPANPSFFYIKVGFKGVFIARTCFPDVKLTHLQGEWCCGVVVKHQTANQEVLCLKPTGGTVLCP